MTAIIVTDLTRMSGPKICLAGYQLDGDRPTSCIRPELQYESLVESWLFSSEGVVRPFSIIDVTLLQVRPIPPHTEDWLVERRYAIIDPFAETHVQPVLLATCSPSVREIYGDSLNFDASWIVLAGTGTRSLGTVVPRSISGVTFRWNDRYGK